MADVGRLARPAPVSRNALMVAGWFVTVSLVALLAGAVIGLDSKVVSLLLVGAISAIIILSLPSVAVFWVLLVVILILTGLVQYFGRVNQVQWIPSILAGAMFFRTILELVKKRTDSAVTMPAGRLPIPAFVWLFALYATVALAANIGNVGSLIQFVAGLKNYIAIWGVLFFIAVAAITPQSLVKIWKGVIVIALLQFGIVLYQHFFVAPKRSLVTMGLHRPAWDSVVGTFGGDPDGGGASGALALFLVVAMTLLMALWKNGLVRTLPLVVGSGLILLSLALAEVKIVLVLVPLAVLLVFLGSFVRRPLAFVSSALLVGSVLVALGLVYQMLYWQYGGGYNIPAAENFERAIETTLDPNNVNPVTGAVGRTASLAIWARDPKSDISEKILGHGFGASRIGATGIGDIARRYYPYQITPSAAASMLWDIGLLGLVAFTAVLVSAALSARRLAREPSIPPFHRAVLEAVTVSLGLVYVTVFYNGDLLYLPATGFLLMLLMGQVAYWHFRINMRPLGAPASSGLDTAGALAPRTGFR